MYVCKYTYVTPYGGGPMVLLAANYFWQLGTALPPAQLFKKEHSSVLSTNESALNLSVSFQEKRHPLRNSLSLREGKYLEEPTPCMLGFHVKSIAFLETSSNPFPRLLHADTWNT